MKTSCILKMVCLLAMGLGVLTWEVRAEGDGSQSDCSATGDQGEEEQDEKNDDDEGDPIRMSNGSFVTAVTDLKLPGLRPLVVKRHYSSSMEKSGWVSPFGTDWDMNYNRFLLLDLSLDEATDETTDEPSPSGNGGSSIASGNQEVSPTTSGRMRYYRGNGTAVIIYFNGYDVSGYDVSGISGYGVTSDGQRYALSADNTGRLVITDKQGNKDILALMTQNATLVDIDPEESTPQTGFRGAWLVESSDAAGNKLTFTRDERMRLLKVENDFGNYLLFEYNESAVNVVTSITDSSGRMWSYHYQYGQGSVKYGRGPVLTEVVYPPTGDTVQGSSRQYEWDVYSRLTKVLNQNGHVTVENEYVEPTVSGDSDPVVGGGTTIISEGGAETTVTNVSGQVARQIYLGQELTYTRTGNEATFVDGKGNIKKYVSDGYGNILHATKYTGQLRGTGEPESYATISEYESKPSKAYWKSKVTHPNGNGMKWQYDTFGNITKVTRFSGTNELSTTYTYNTNWLHQVTSVTDANGNATIYDYGTPQSNPCGKVLKITYPTTAAGQAEEEFTYNTRGQILTFKAADGIKTKYEYDNQSGRLTQRILDYGSDNNHKNYATSYTYDQWGNVASITDAKGNTTNYAYNTAGKLTQVIQPTGKTATYTYNALGKVVRAEKTGADGMVQRGENIYNEYEQLIATKIYSDATSYLETTYTYDGNGNRVGMTDPMGHTTTAVYDARDLLWRATDANNHTVQYAYDGNQNLVAMTDELGRNTGFEFDGFNRPVKKTYADESYEAQVFDANGNVLNIRTSGGNHIVATYDERNRKTTESYGTSLIGFNYDQVGRLLSATENGAAIQYEYNTLGWVTKFTDQAGRVSNYEYDANGNRVNTQYPSSVTVTRSFDSVNQLTAINHGAQTVAAYQYDSLGRVQRIDFGNGTDSQFNFNALNRLLNVNNSLGDAGRNYSYTYNAAGDRTSMTGPRGTVNYGYDNVGQLLSVTEPAGSPFAAQNFTYDAAKNRETWTLGGNLTQYEVNELNQYTSITNYLGPVWNGDGGLQSFNGKQYTYDALKRLVAVTTQSNKVLFSYDPLGRRVRKEVQNLGGQTLAVYEYHHDGDEVAVEYRPDNVWTYYIGPMIDRIVARSNASNQYQYYYHDGLGSVSAVADGGGNVLEQYEYNPQGQVVITDSNNQTHAATQISNNLLFCGRNLDFETGDYYVRARYYSPALGRFISRDPLLGAEFSQGSNLYAYCRNRFVNSTDPYGMDEEKPDFKSDIDLRPDDGDPNSEETTTDNPDDKTKDDKTKIEPLDPNNTKPSTTVSVGGKFNNDDKGSWGAGVGVNDRDSGVWASAGVGGNNRGLDGSWGASVGHKSTTSSIAVKASGNSKGQYYEIRYSLPW
jgi:RHS repeat-associated protein